MIVPNTRRLAYARLFAAMMRRYRSLAFLALPLGATGCTLLFPVDGYGPASYRNEVMADEPVVYLRFGEQSGTVAHDALGQHDAAYGTGVVLGAEGAIAGDSDTAVTFNGAVDSNVAMPPGLDFPGLAPFSVEIWAWQYDYDGFGWLVDHQAYGNRNGWAILSSSARVGYERYRNNMYSGPDASSPTGMMRKAWHHIVATFDGDRLVLYLDGTLVSEATGGGPIDPMTSSWRVGRQNCGCTGDNFIGSLDELAIYDKALDASRVHAHYVASGR